MVAPLLNAVHTSTLCVMSHEMIVCLYPKLFASRSTVLLCGPRYSRSCLFSGFEYGLTQYQVSKLCYAFGGRCGEACPAIRRKLMGVDGWAKGIGIVRWGGINKMLAREYAPVGRLYLHGNNCRWKIDGDCLNVICIHYRRRIQTRDAPID